MQRTYYTSLVFLSLVLLYRLCLCVYPVVVTLIVVDIIGPLNYEMTFAQPIAKLANMIHHVIVLGGINILLSVYGITNSKQYLVFHGILI